MNDAGVNSMRSLLRPPPLAVASQVCKCLLNVALLGCLGYVFIKFLEGGLLPVIALVERSWKLGLASFFGFWWANIFTGRILMKKLTQWDIAHGPDYDTAWLGSVLLSILNLIVRWLLVPVVNILFAWFIQAWLLNLFVELSGEVSWVGVLLHGLVVTPLVMTIADHFLLIPLAWMATPFNLYSMRVLSVEAADSEQKMVCESQDDPLERGQNRQDAMAESADKLSQHKSENHGCFSMLFAWMAIACLLIPVAEVFRFNGFKSIPLIGQLPVLSAIGMCWFFGFLSNRFSKVDNKISLADGAVAMWKSLPGYFWATFVAVIQFAFAFNLFALLFYGAAPVLVGVGGVVRLSACYLMGYMLGRLYLRLSPFHCDKPASGFRWRGFLMSTVYVASFYGFFGYNNEALFPKLFYFMFVLIPLYMTILTFTGDKVLRGDLPYVVFLRRFNRYADRAVLGTVLNGLPSGLSAAFLVSQSSRLITWDPIVTLLNGITRGNPSRGLPFYLISKDDTWAQNVHCMLDKASAVVMDVSDPSESIRQEVCLLATGSMLDRVLFLANHKTAATAFEFLQTHGIDCAQVQIVIFHRSWSRAVPRMILGLVGTFYSMVFLFYSLQIFDPSFSNLTANICILVSTLILFPIFFVKPAIDRDSAEKIKVFLKHRELKRV